MKKLNSSLQLQSSTWDFAKDGITGDFKTGIIIPSYCIITSFIFEVQQDIVGNFQLNIGTTSNNLYYYDAGGITQVGFLRIASSPIILNVANVSNGEEIVLNFGNLPFVPTITAGSLKLHFEYINSIL